MAVIIYLDDGRQFYRSTFGVSGMLFLIAEEAERPKLKRWLKDMSERCAPFLDFDIRSFAAEDRDDFWTAAAKAYDKLVVEFGPGLLEIPNMYTANCLHDALQEHRKILAGEWPVEGGRGPAIPFLIADFDELWFTSDGGPE